MAITATERTQIIELTTLMFSAAPGATYLSQIVALYEGNGRKLDVLAAQLAQTSVYTALNPGFQTSAEFATKLLTPLGLQGDAIATDFVVSRLNAGASKASVVYAAFQALNGIVATDAAIYQNAKATLLNKTTVAEYYSATLLGSATDLATLQSVVGTVTADPATVTAAQNALSSITGQTFSLTTSVDTIIGTAGNDTINATNSATSTTLGGLDSIDGGAGTDTFNIVDTLTAAGAAFALAPGLTVKNVENLNVVSNGSIGVAGTAFDVSGFSGLTKAVFTAAGNGTTATNVKVADTASASVTVAAGDATIAGGTADSIVNASAAGISTISGKALTSASVKGGGNVQINNVDAATGLVAGGGSTLTAVTLDGNTGGATLQGKGLTTVTLNNLTAAATETINNATAKHALTLNVSGAGKTGQVITVADANAQTVAVNAAGSANNVLLSTGAANTVLTGVTVAGSGPLTLDLASATNTAVASFDGSAATGNLTLSNLSAATVSVKTGSGKDSFTALQTAKATIDTGAGNDTVTVGAAIAAGSTINLGAGDDTLAAGGGSILTSATATSVIDGGDGVDTVSATLVTAGTAGLFKNFEGLDLTGYNAVIDANLLTGSTIANLLVNDLAGNINTAVIQNVAAAGTLTVTGFVDQAAINTAYLHNVTTTQAAGSSMAITFNAAPTAVAATVGGGNFADLGTVTTTGDATVSINSTGGTNLNGNGINSLVDTANTITKVTITGDKAFTLGGVSATGATVTTQSVLTAIDGSAATGKLSITANTSGTVKFDGMTITGGSNDDTISSDIIKATINGGAGKDAITVGGLNATVNAGDGNDTITVSANGAAGDVVTVNGGAGADKVVSALLYKAVASATSSATDGDFVSFNDAASGDLISFANVANASGLLGAKASVGAAQTFDQAVFLAESATANTVTWFQYAGNTYVESSGATVGAGASIDNIVVKLVGLIDLSSAAVVTGAAGTITLA